ncbi:hypothetical protein Gotur_003013 [Gossypium turneri]
MRPNHGDDKTITELNLMEWKCNNVQQDSKRVQILDSKELQGHNEFLVSGVQKEQRKDRANLHLAIAIVLVRIADGSEEMEAAMIIDILRRAKANVVVASVGDNLEILASRKVKLVADMLLDEATKLTYDLAVLPVCWNSVIFPTFAKSDKLVNLLKKQAESNKPYGAICASPALVLEPHGLLKWWIQRRRRGRFHCYFGETTTERARPQDEARAVRPRRSAAHRS